MKYWVSGVNTNVWTVFISVGHKTRGLFVLWSIGPRGDLSLRLKILYGLITTIMVVKFSTWLFLRYNNITGITISLSQGQRPFFDTCCYQLLGPILTSGTFFHFHADVALIVPVLGLLQGALFYSLFMAVFRPHYECACSFLSEVQPRH